MVDAHRTSGRYLRLSYSYHAGEFQSGEYHFFVRQDFSGEEIAHLLKGISVDALYDLRHPDRSTFRDATLYAAAARRRATEAADELPAVSELRFDIARYNRTTNW